MNLARVIMRTTIGGLFVGHGTQKLFGWFQGGGLAGTADMFEHLGLHPPRRNAIAAGVSETAGGAMLFAGLATPLAAGTLTATMLTAIRRVHLPNGPWITKGGYEYNLVLIAAALALVEDGPGRPSLDNALGISERARAGRLPRAPRAQRAPSRPTGWPSTRRQSSAASSARAWASARARRRPSRMAHPVPV
jgi:putative oxidoreductase